MWRCKCPLFLNVSSIFSVSGQQVILKNLDDGRKLSVHIFLQQTGVVLQVSFTGASPKQVTVAGGTEIYRFKIPFLQPTHTSFFVSVHQPWNCQWPVIQQPILESLWTEFSKLTTLTLLGTLSQKPILLWSLRPRILSSSSMLNTGKQFCYLGN